MLCPESAPVRGSKSMTTLRLPIGNGEWQTYTATDREPWPVSSEPIRSRIPYAAAHVVVDPLADADPVADPHLDGRATLASRHYLWSLGLPVAEAMDTAQRGMGLGWEMAKELIRRSAAE